MTNQALERRLMKRNANSGHNAVIRRRFFKACDRIDRRNRGKLLEPRKYGNIVLMVKRAYPKPSKIHNGRKP